MFGWIKNLWYKYVQLPWWLYRFEPRLKKKAPVYEAALQAKMTQVGRQIDERNQLIAEFLRSQGVKPGPTYKREDTWKTESDVDFEARMKVHYNDDITLDELKGPKKP